MNDKECIRCGSLDRYKSGKCKKCTKERCKKYSNDNKELLKAKYIEYYKNNKEIIKKRTSDWRNNNILKYKEYNKIYYIKNKDKINKKSKEYRYKNYQKVKNTIKEWCKNNKERLRFAKNKYVADNINKITEYKSKWHSENKERMNALSRKWSKDNPEKTRVIRHNRKSKIRNDGGKLSAGLFDELFYKQNGICVYCKTYLTKQSTHMDHIMPIKLGGKNIDINIQLLCATCNLQKGDKHPDIFKKQKGY